MPKGYSIQGEELKKRGLDSVDIPVPEFIQPRHCQLVCCPVEAEMFAGKSAGGIILTESEVTRMQNTCTTMLVLLVGGKVNEGEDEADQIHPGDLVVIQVRSGRRIEDPNHEQHYFMVDQADVLAKSKRFNVTPY